MFVVEFEVRFFVVARDVVDVNYFCFDFVYVYVFFIVGYGVVDDEMICVFDKICYWC